MKKRWVLLSLLFIATSLGFAQDWDSKVPATLDSLVANYSKPYLQTAFGTFTYAYQDLPTPFSRWLEESLAASIAKCANLKLFNREAAAAMDPAFRSIYGDYFKTNGVDALLAGRYFDEGETVRAHLELTSLSDGILVGTVDLTIPKATLPEGLQVEPAASTAATASSIGNLVDEPEKGALGVSVSTERGEGAVYRQGEDMVVLVTVSKEAWIKVYHIDVDGKIQLILPNRFSPGAAIEPGRIVRIPGSGDPFAFKMTPPYGTEFIKVIASTRPFASDEADFEELGGDARGVITRGLVVTGSDKPERAEAMASYVIMPAK